MKLLKCKFKTLLQVNFESFSISYRFFQSSLIVNDNLCCVSIVEYRNFCKLNLQTFIISGHLQLQCSVWWVQYKLRCQPLLGTFETCLFMARVSTSPSCTIKPTERWVAGKHKVFLFVYINQICSLMHFYSIRVFSQILKSKVCKIRHLGPVTCGGKNWI